LGYISRTRKDTNAIPLYTESATSVPQPDGPIKISAFSEICPLSLILSRPLLEDPENRFFRTSRTPRYSEEKKLRVRKVAPHKFPAEISPDLSRGTKSGIFKSEIFDATSYDREPKKLRHLRRPTNCAPKTCAFKNHAPRKTRASKNHAPPCNLRH
jgi:hypothetical protein